MATERGECVLIVILHCKLTNARSRCPGELRRSAFGWQPRSIRGCFAEPLSNVSPACCPRKLTLHARSTGDESYEDRCGAVSDNLHLIKVIEDLIGNLGCIQGLSCMDAIAINARSTPVARGFVTRACRRQISTQARRHPAGASQLWRRSVLSST